MKRLSERKRVTSIIDNTAAELFPAGSGVGENTVAELFETLGQMGVDLIEAGADACLAVRSRPLPGNIILRLNKNDIAQGRFEGLKAVGAVLQVGHREDMRRVEKLAAAGIDVTAEIEEGNPPNGGPLGETAKGLRDAGAKVVRLRGLHTGGGFEELHALRELADRLGLKLDICPENRYHTATASAVEAFLAEADYVTSSFAGYGAPFGFAATEEVTAACRALGIRPFNGLEKLPAMTGLFKRLTGKEIAGNKAVIGERIFHYESGIHAHGIRANPQTYEPFDPSSVGLERRLLLGKHSGTTAVIAKLEELGISCDRKRAFEVLELVRARSINLKRGLCDKEVLDICEVIGWR